ncbi:endospore germination permease [Desulfotomaculum nigrificans]|uniref:endospore germination permease n=1 Tax=Desulfotomaculum nigrificans TaxID=1565 RepID=UPI0009DF1922
MRKRNWCTMRNRGGSREEGRISSRQELLLMTNFLLASAILLTPTGVVSEAKQDGWMAILLGMVVGIGIAALYTTLGLRFPRQTLVQYAEVILGKILGKAVGLLFVWFALHLGSVVVCNFGTFVTTTVMPETPLAAVNIAIMLVVMLVVYRGLEVFARVNEILTLLVVIATVLILLLPINELSYKNFLPVLENGWQPVLKASLVPITFPFGETVLFAMILPYINKPEQAQKGRFVAIMVGGILLTVTTMVILAIFGPTGTAERIYPTLSLARYISVAGFIERIDAIPMAIWAASGFTKISLCFYVFVTGVAQIFNLKDYKVLILPSAVLMTFLSMVIYRNILEQINFAVKIWPVYSLPFEVGIPILLLVISVIRGLKEKAR